MAFTVVSIAREPLPIMTRFIDWYLAQGAERIVLYLDDPDDPAIGAFSGRPRLDLRPCTEAVWKHLGTSADRKFTRRQKAALTGGYHEIADGWILMVDADELMWFPGQTLAEAVAAFPADATSVRVQSAEQVFLAEGGEALRLPIPRASVNEIFGADADLFRPRMGLVGHPEGKSFHRAGIDGARFMMHWGFDAEGARLPETVLGPQDGGHLVHYAAPGFGVWMAKVGWRTASWGYAEPVKQALLTLAETEAGEDAYRALYRKLHVIDTDLAARLEAAGGLRRDGPPLTGG